MEYESLVECESPDYAGVRYKVRRPSFARRLELLKRLRELAARLEFQRAGEMAVDRVDAALLDGEVERAYLEWGLESIEGLEVDGIAATSGSLIDRGPEGLCREIAERVRRECLLGQEQRKN